jgi:hypothetical protein
MAFSPDNKHNVERSQAASATAAAKAVPAIFPRGESDGKYYRSLTYEK